MQRFVLTPARTSIPKIDKSRWLYGFLLFTLLFSGWMGTGCQCDGLPPSTQEANNPEPVIQQPDAGAPPESAKPENKGGEKKQTCPPGEHSDGKGGCTSDPCTPNPCTKGEKTRCVVEQDNPRCVCPSGTHLDGNKCVKDEQCRPDTCHQHGTCSVKNGLLSCSCQKGYKGKFCKGCDESSGYYPSPKQPGTCTQNPCSPNPCSTPGRTACSVEKGKVKCDCDPGTHDENGRCVADVTCQKNTCNGHGVCQQQGKKVSCRCQLGYRGTFCNQCDDTKGYHPDGKGGCTDDPCLPNPCKTTNRTRCQVNAGQAKCLCDAGYHDESGQCKKDDKCQPNSCNGHGTCKIVQGKIGCQCQKGYKGKACDQCDSSAGYHPDGKGGCTDDPCVPNPCKTTNRTRCQKQGTKAQCLCDPGTHEEKGKCVADRKCTANTCNKRGKCKANQGQVSCTCDPGYTGPFCLSCDKPKGYHPDGKGGCTNDPCIPNPCKTPGQTVCQGSGRQFTCKCSPGFHDENGKCLKDEVCTAKTCSGHGTCKVVSGKTQCVCQKGYKDKACDKCDSGAGYHSDGKGGCTNDPCVPNPCKKANQTTCKALGTKAQCNCDSGYHSDGQGGCTNDPCTPDPCKAQNKACRVSAGKAVCYTPTCNDNNPCTKDTLQGGKCVYAKLSDGSSCSTTLCLQKQTCQNGKCLGGSQTNCNDNNPCTKDSCDAIQGCQNKKDDTLVPDDKKACTIDKCSNGVASHTAVHSRCDDNLYCTGVEECRPKDSKADSKGCIHTKVPQAPPSPGPCQSYGSCQESSQSFPLIKKSPGAQCDDGIPCTQQDVCNSAGTCQGTPITNCALTSCQNPSTQISTIDIPTSVVAGKVTLNGSPLPNDLRSSSSGYGYFYLQAKDTGYLHQVTNLQYKYRSTGRYTLIRDNFSTRIVPGIYDLVFIRGLYNGKISQAHSQYDVLPNAYRKLQTNLVIGKGNYTLNIDIPTTSVSGKVTLNGQPLPNDLRSSSSGYGYFYLKAKDTGYLHQVTNLQYKYRSTGRYTLIRDNFSTRVTPGTYDLIFVRGLYNGKISQAHSQYDVLPNAYRVLKSNIQIPKGSYTLNIDIPTSAVSGKVTLNGSPLPKDLRSSSSGYGYFYLKAKGTGYLHQVTNLQYKYVSTGRYSLIRDNFNTRLTPGTYDLVFIRGLYNGKISQAHSQYDVLPNAYRVLKSNIQIPKGNYTLNIDIPTSSVSGKVTLNGSPLPKDLRSSSSGYGYFYLKAKGTGYLHQVTNLQYKYVSTGRYSLIRDNFNTRLTPGAYDLVFIRGLYNGKISQAHSQYDVLPNAYRILKSNIQIPKGNHTLNIDIPTSSVSGKVTLNGSPLPNDLRSSSSGYGYFYLKAQGTGYLHQVTNLQYKYVSTGRYKLIRDNFTTRLTPGTYDLIFIRGLYNGKISQAHSQYDVLPNAYRVLKSNIQIPKGNYTLNIDIPAKAVAGKVTLNGQSLPVDLRSSSSGYGYFYLQANQTKYLHQITNLQYKYISTGRYKLIRDSFNTRLTPGKYQLVFIRGLYNGKISQAHSQYDVLPNAYRVLQACVEIK